MAGSCRRIHRRRLLISGVHALRGKSLTFRTMVYGAVVLALIVAGVLVCNLSNPALTYIM